MELKPDSIASRCAGTVSRPSFNRTSMELKHSQADLITQVYAIPMELKHLHDGLTPSLLIEPVWN